MRARAEPPDLGGKERRGKTKESLISPQFACSHRVVHEKMIKQLSSLSTEKVGKTNKKSDGSASQSVGSIPDTDPQTHTQHLGPARASKCRVRLVFEISD